MDDLIRKSGLQDSLNAFSILFAVYQNIMIGIPERIDGSQKAENAVRADTGMYIILLKQLFKAIVHSGIVDRDIRIIRTGGGSKACQNGGISLPRIDLQGDGFFFCRMGVFCKKILKMTPYP